MLHRVGASLFLAAIVTIFFRYFKFINNKKLVLNVHITTGSLGAIAMIIYSILDFIQYREATILPVGLASALIIISGTKKVRKKYRWLHLTSVIAFALALAFHIIY